MSVGGRIGERTEGWRTISYCSGDTLADLATEFADAQEDPEAAFAAIVTVVELSDRPVDLIDYLAGQGCNNALLRSADLWRNYLNKTK